MLRKSSAHLLAFASLVASGVLLTGQQPAGRACTPRSRRLRVRRHDEANCASCHGSDLMGAPPLAGDGFIGRWSTRNTRDLLHPDSQLDADGQPGRPVRNNYANIVAFILQFNGVPAGTTPLTPTTDVRIGGPRSRGDSTLHRPRHSQPQPRRRQPDAARARGAAAGGGRGRGQQPPPTGLTVKGEVKNFTPVTDEMLRNPRAGRLADAAPRSVRVELQPAEPDHARQRDRSAAGVGLADERRRHQSARAARLTTARSS